VLPYQLSSKHQREQPLPRRAAGLALALAINLLLLLVLLSLGVGRVDRPKGSPTVLIDLLPEAHNAAPPAPQPAANPTARSQTQIQPAPAIKPPPIVIPSKPTIAQPKSSSLLELNSTDMAASDIAHMPSGGDGAEGDSEQVGRGPNGQVLYAAEWARRPTNAELGGYLPRNAPDGWGLVACKTIPGDRVEDCQEIDQQPLGSHLASAVRQAAWQFRVRPPRKNGKELVGSWVRIRIDYESGPSGSWSLD